jgi:hypothetical protein
MANEDNPKHYKTLYLLYITALSHQCFLYVLKLTGQTNMINISIHQHISPCDNVFMYKTTSLTTESHYNANTLNIYIQQLVQNGGKECCPHCRYLQIYCFLSIPFSARRNLNTSNGSCMCVAQVGFSNILPAMIEM